VKNLVTELATVIVFIRKGKGGFMYGMLIEQLKQIFVPQK